MVGPVSRRQLCTKPLFLPAERRNKLKHTQGFAQIQCPGRAGVENTKAEQREARPPLTGSLVGCWGAQPLWPHNKSQFSSISPFTQSLLSTPLQTALAQTGTALSCGRPADFLACQRGRRRRRQLRQPYNTQMPPSHVWKSTG